MNIIETGIPGLLEIEPKVFTDPRGYFFESYNDQVFKANGLNYHFVQDNQSKSGKGVLRGLHFQRPPFAQAKLVRVLSGSVLDVAVDIRRGSPTYGKWHSVILTAEKNNQMLIPRGFAHGFLVLTETAEFFYKCDNFYNKESDGGIRFDDPGINIDWGTGVEHLILSDKDKVLPMLSEIDNPFEYQP
ncbi:MAG: dTDP-4-dehydrorhamnose 3,5-epimerase [Chitinophagales bacterium]|nr:dTDP-4-dehydrorhamnose 3,5-epimerase [Chitinophagales bacterium]